MVVAAHLDLIPLVRTQSWKSTPFTMTLSMTFSGRLGLSLPQPALSHLFSNYWKAKYPTLIIRQLCNNICGEYIIYPNYWKYGARAKEVCEQKDALVQEDNEKDDNSSLTTPATLEQEKLITDATLHVKQSIEMREMAEECVALAQSTAHTCHIWNAMIALQWTTLRI
jgi:hypothetical protein